MKNLINDLVISNEEIYAYLDELVDKGHEIVANWDGGNDSGMVYFTVDGNIVNPESPFDYAIFDRLEEMINDKLGYGSWAGDFHAYGEAQYDHKTHSFIGDNTEEIIDYNSEDLSLVLRILITKTYTVR
jgi:NADH:ubiquinone oxidoreductase subunit F (NADH-binding)